MVQLMDDSYCVLLDLPGHGSTDFVASHDLLSIDSYLKSVREFVELMGLDKQQINLVGFSFGGVLASLYTHAFPEHVNKLALLAPGFKTPITTKVQDEMALGENFEHMIPTSARKLSDMGELYTFKQRWVIAI